MKAEDIQPGKCYKTKGPESYKVLSINGGVVTYRTWTSPLRINAPVKGFADAVTAAVSCPPNV